jgi:hypothetical protein
MEPTPWKVRRTVQAACQPFVDAARASEIIHCTTNASKHGRGLKLIRSSRLSHYLTPSDSRASPGGRDIGTDLRARGAVAGDVGRSGFGGAACTGVLAMVVLATARAT